MAEGSEASRLRLSSARRRIDAFIEQIDVLAASSFPHEDGRRALAAIRSHCLILKEDLDVAPGTRDDVIDRLCLILLDKVANYTDILGFILRSTNVRNPFELHFVVKGMVEQALGTRVDLLISSEWAYVPFTYPMSVDQLDDCILIGTPAPESSNPLLIPLAGHEVGHSAWRVYGCTPLYTDMVSEAVERHLEGDVRAKRELLGREKLGELELNRVVNECADYVMQQLEEIFCDLFGLFLFGHAFVAAFDYLLGPGGYDRSLEYPSDGQRMAVLVEAAHELAIKLDPSMTDRWTASLASRNDRPMAAVADKVTASLVPVIGDFVFAQLRATGLTSPGLDTVDHVLDAYRRGEPHHERAELGEIISAGWLRLRELDVDPLAAIPAEKREEVRRKSYRVLTDLVLKTIEIAEFHDRTAGHAQR